VSVVLTVPAALEKTLGQVLCFIRGVPPATRKIVEWVPNRVGTTGLKRATPLCLALRRRHDDRPARGVKARRDHRWRTMVAFHSEFSMFNQL
jgi:hypothetical protein